MEFKMQESDDQPLPVSFQLKNPEFLLKNPDFLLINVDFIIQQPLGDELKPRAWRMVHTEVADRWKALKDATGAADLIAESSAAAAVEKRMWGSFQTSQVLLRDVSERLGLDDIEGTWEHLWTKKMNKPQDARDRSTRPTITWLYPAGAWIMCAGHEVAIPAAAWSRDLKSKVAYSSPKNWLLLGGFQDNGNLDPDMPGHAEWDVLSRVTDEKFRAPDRWLDADGNAVELGKLMKSQKKIDPAAAYKARFAARAPTADALESPEDPDAPLTTNGGPEDPNGTPVSLKRLTGTVISNRPLLFTMCSDSDLPPQAGKKKGGDKKREQEVLTRIIAHIKSKEPTISRATKLEKPALQFLDPNSTTKHIQLPKICEDFLINHLTSGGDPRLPEGTVPWGGEQYVNIRKHGSYTCKMCVKAQNGKGLRDYVDSQIREAQKRITPGPSGVDKPGAIKLLAVLQGLFADMPDLWFPVMGLLSFVYSGDDSDEGKKEHTKHMTALILGSETAVSASGAAPRDTGALLSAMATDPQPSGELSPLLRKYWYIEKNDYSTVRQALRRSFSGELVREVEAEYFRDDDRMAQGIVIDLARMVQDRGDTIRETFGNAKWLVRDDRKARKDQTPLTTEEVQKVFTMLGISMGDKDGDGSVFKAVMKILDTDGDGSLSYDEFHRNVTKTASWVERNMGKFSYLEAREMLQILDARLRNKKYRFFKMVITAVTHPSRTSVRVVGAVVTQKPEPWITVPAGAAQEDHNAKPDEDVTLKLLQPQEVVVRSYVISAEALMPKDDDGLADPYVVTTLGGMSQGSEKHKRHSLEPYFGQCHEFSTKLPGASQLKMTVYDDDIFGKDPMGETSVDLENLWFSDTWRRSGRHGFKPIEKRTLLLRSKRAAQGELRMWVDIIKRDECSRHPKIDICKPPGIAFELRVVVWTAERLPAMDQMTNQNDAFITAELVGTKDDANGSDILLRQETDVHWLCKASDTRGAICPPTCPKGYCGKEMSCWGRFKCLFFFLRCNCCCAKKEQTDARTNAEWNWCDSGPVFFDPCFTHFWTHIRSNLTAQAVQI